MKMYSLLKKKGLDSDSKIEKKILQDWSISRILEFNEEINEVIIPISSVEKKEIPTYQFTANAELGGQPYGGCSGVDCRIARIDELSRFAALWADKVYVHSYFDEHYIKDMANEVSGIDYGEFRFRMDYVGSLKNTLRIKPLVEKGIIEIISGGAWLCRHCMAEKIRQCDDVQKVFDRSISDLADEYRREVELTISKDDEKGGAYRLNVKVPKEINHHEYLSRYIYSAPEWMQKMCEGQKNNVKLGRRYYQKLRVPEDLIRGNAEGVVFSQVLSIVKDLKASLLTNSHIEVQLLNDITGIESNSDMNRILQQELTCELPLIIGVPIEVLLEIREKEHEAFRVYRESIRAATNEYLSKRLGVAEARELYEDVIIPKLNELDSQLRVIKDRASRNLKLDLVVLATCCCLGLLSDWVPMALLLGASGVTGVDIVKNIGKRYMETNEIKSNNFYFLWKLSRQKMKQRIIR